MGTYNYITNWLSNGISYVVPYYFYRNVGNISTEKFNITEGIKLTHNKIEKFIEKLSFTGE